MAGLADDLTGQLSRERKLLSKAEVEIENGRDRVRAQERLLEELKTSGRKTAEAQRLSDVFKRLLVEWERRRGLIEQRIAHLEHDGRRAPPGR
jgi:hypothetical protein